MEEYPTYKPDVLIGTSLQVIAPLGQYDGDKLLNIGTDRWGIKPEVGVSKTMGKLTLELVNALTIYTDNGDFLNGKTREQSPLYSLQTHAVYSFTRGIWGSLDFLGTRAVEPRSTTSNPTTFLTAHGSGQPLRCL